MQLEVGIVGLQDSVFDSQTQLKQKMESHTQLKKKLSSQTQLKPKVHSLLNFVLSPDHVRRIGPQNTAEVEKLKLKNTEYLFGVMPVARLL